MTTRAHTIAITLFFLAIFAFCLDAMSAPLALLAQTDVTPGGLAETIGNLAAKYPWLVTLFIVVGALRLLFKPILAAAHYYTAATQSTADDQALEKFESGPIYRALAFTLDLFASVKLPK